MNWGALDFALVWIRESTAKMGGQTDDGGLVWVFRSVWERRCICEYCDRVRCVCVCVCIVIREDGALLVPVKEQEKGEEGLSSLSPGLPLLVHWAGQSERRPRHATWSEPECSWKQFKKYRRRPEPRSAFCGAWSASNIEHLHKKFKKAAAFYYYFFLFFMSIQLLFWPHLVVMVNICGSCHGDARVLSLTEMKQSFSLARGDSGKGKWLVISWFHLAFQGHRVALASSLACPGSALSLPNSELQERKRKTDRRSGASEL